MELRQRRRHVRLLAALALSVIALLGSCKRKGTGDAPPRPAGEPGNSIQRTGADSEGGDGSDPCSRGVLVYVQCSSHAAASQGSLEGVPRLGPPDAPVKVVFYTDVVSEKSRRIKEKLDLLMNSLGSRMAVYVKLLPGVPLGLVKALSRDRDSFWRLYDYYSRHPIHGPAVHDPVLERNQEEARRLGIQDSALVVVNGMVVSEERMEDTITSALESPGQGSLVSRLKKRCMEDAHWHSLFELYARCSRTDASCAAVERCVKSGRIRASLRRVPSGAPSLHSPIATGSGRRVLFLFDPDSREGWRALEEVRGLSHRMRFRLEVLPVPHEGSPLQRPIVAILASAGDGRALERLERLRPHGLGPELMELRRLSDIQDSPSLEQWKKRLDQARELLYSTGTDYVMVIDGTVVSTIRGITPGEVLHEMLGPKQKER